MTKPDLTQTRLQGLILMMTLSRTDDKNIAGKDRAWFRDSEEYDQAEQYIKELRRWWELENQQSLYTPMTRKGDK